MTVTVDRILDLVGSSHAVGRLQKFLRELRDQKKLISTDFRVTGTTDDTREAVKNAIAGGHLTLRELAHFVDEVEETGGQHVLLFNLSADGQRLSAPDLDALFPRTPVELPAELYSAHPPNRFVWSERDEALVVKQVQTGEYWEKVGETEQTASGDSGWCGFDEGPPLVTDSDGLWVNHSTVLTRVHCSNIWVPFLLGADDQQHEST